MALQLSSVARVQDFHGAINKNASSSSQKSTIGNSVVAAIHALKLANPSLDQINQYLSENLGLDVNANAPAIQSFFDSTMKSGLPEDFESSLKTTARRRRKSSGKRKKRSGSRRKGSKRRKSGRRKSKGRKSGARKTKRRRRGKKSPVNGDDM